MKISAEKVASVIFTMCPVPTPEGLLTGASLAGDTVTFRREDGTHTKAYRIDDQIEVGGL